MCCRCANWLKVDFFFFQAEDGIRDADVTGVQTCALPISESANGPIQASASDVGALVGELVEDYRAAAAEKALTLEIEPAERVMARVNAPHVRSEERRVGKECRSRRGAAN